MDERIRPGRWLYGLAVLILAVGITLFVITLVNTITGVGDSINQYVVPGRNEIVFEKAGKYTIFHEYRSLIGNKIYNSDSSLNGLSCSLTDKSTNMDVQLSATWASSKYEIGSREGVSVFEFTIEKPGTYVLNAWYDNNNDGSETVLGVGQGFGGGFLLSIFGMIGIMLVSIILFIFIIVLTYAKRRRYKKELERKIIYQ